MLDEPLGLTVHSLPNPREAASGEVRRTTTGRVRMLLVMLVCAAPVLASYFTYYVVRPQSRAAHGELVEPQRPLPATPASTPDGRAVNLSTLRGQWLLVSVGTGACDPGCEKRLYLQRQLREGLGKDKDRVDWVWLVEDGAPVRAAIQPALAQATVLRVPRETLTAWLGTGESRASEDAIFLVDPMGNYMMRFAVSPGAQVDVTNAKNIKRDLERLLRASSSWDQPGRP